MILQTQLARTHDAPILTATEARTRIDEAFDQTARILEFELSVEYAEILLRESELEDIIHYFVYTADDWADYCLERL